MARNLVSMTARATKKAARATETGAMRTMTMRVMTEPSLRKEGDDGPPLAARVHNNQILGNINGKERGGYDSEGDGGRGYKDDGEDGGNNGGGGDGGNDGDDGVDGGDDDAKWQ
jgi:hypothetical protein